LAVKDWNQNAEGNRQRAGRQGSRGAEGRGSRRQKAESRRQKAEGRETGKITDRKLTARRKVHLDIIVEQLYVEYHHPLALVSVRGKPRPPDPSKRWVPISGGDRDLT